MSWIVNLDIRSYELFVPSNLLNGQHVLDSALLSPANLRVLRLVSMERLWAPEYVSTRIDVGCQSKSEEMRRFVRISQTTMIATQRQKMQVGTKDTLRRHPNTLTAV